MSTCLVLDLRGRLRNFRLPAYRALVPVFEAIMNSVHAIEASGRSDGRISVEVLRNHGQHALTSGDQTGRSPISGFRISDNGVGFTDENFESFCTSDSTFKSAMGGRGIGRFTWLKAFRSVRIQSVYSDSVGVTSKRAFAFSDQGILDNAVEADDGRAAGTTVTLDEIENDYAQHVPRKLGTLVQRIVDHCFVAIRAAGSGVSLEAVDGEESIDVSDQIAQMFATALHDDVEVAGATFRLTHLRVTSPEVAGHRLAFLANGREVTSENLANAISQLRAKLTDDDGRGFWWLSLVESAALDASVSPERDSFLISEQPLELFPNELSMKLLREKLMPVLLERLDASIAPVKERAEQRVREYVQKRAPEYRHLLTMRLEEIQALPPDLTDDRLDAELHRVTYQVETEIRERGRQLLAAPSDGNAAYDEFLSEANTVGKANLAKYVVHRKVMLDLFRKALGTSVVGKYELEEAVHKIIFPLRSASDQVRYDDLNLWMIDERLAYHEYLASDKELRTIPVLESDGQQRPDLIIFNTPFAFVDHPAPFGSIVIVEFKRPARDDYNDEDNPIKQVYDYVRKVRAGRAKDRAGRPFDISEHTPFYCYLVCDLTRKLRETAQNYQLTETPDSQGLFGFNAGLRAYVEVISFDKLLQDAEKRNRILFAKLNLP